MATLFLERRLNSHTAAPIKPYSSSLRRLRHPALQTSYTRRTKKSSLSKENSRCVYNLCKRTKKQAKLRVLSIKSRLWKTSNSTCKITLIVWSSVWLTLKVLPWTSFHSPCQPSRLPSPLSDSQHCLPRPCPATSLPLATRRSQAPNLSTSLPQATALAPARPHPRPGPRPRLASHAGSVWSARLSPAPVQPAAPPLPRASNRLPTYMRLATPDLRRYFRRYRLHPHPQYFQGFRHQE
ncbi:hypothetical protein QC761_300005 [Podospora bellae-mahoneyi]|uniref:Uncharacterized protein n=1 Tax=Podospora bellae-mahoneyi TaxID=2093777 RepID=A0ABR0FIW4_9PEZI|nr:hypothetical protein QC761_300005 [Podospora bellae-mahoneyi]